MIRIALVEDYRLVRQTLRKFLDEIDGFQIVEEAECGADYERKYDPGKIDVTLLDLRLKGQHGLTTCRNLVRKYPGIKIVVMSEYDDDTTVLTLIREGACAFISKTDEISVVETTIRNVIDQGFYFNKDIGSMMRTEMVKVYKRRLSGESEMPNFSKTELQIAIHVCNQLTAKKIAEEMNLRERTIETHKQSMIEKTFSVNFNGVLIYLFKNHLLYPEDMQSDVALQIPKKLSA